MAKVELKAPIVDEISGHLNGAQGVVLVDYRGLTVEQDTQLRKQLREAGVVYKVYKNTLVKRAIAGTEFEPMTDMLEGPTAIAICATDATAPARILSNFAKTAEALELKCGVVEGTYYDAAGIQTIASIPSREELLSKFLGSIQSPITLHVLLSRSLKRTKKLLNFRVRIQNVSMEMLNRVCTDTVWTVRAAAQ